MYLDIARSLHQKVSPKIKGGEATSILMPIFSRWLLSAILILMDYF